MYSVFLNIYINAHMFIKYTELLFQQYSTVQPHDNKLCLNKCLNFLIHFHL